MRTVTSFLLAAIVALVALSLTMLSSATMLDRGGQDVVRNQLWATLLGFVGLGLAASIDYRRTGRLAWILYGISLALLVLVLTPLGHESKGARRWLYGTQPSEIAKFALILALATYGANRAHLMHKFWNGICLGFGVAFPVLVLVALEPDRGTTALLLMVTTVMLLMAGVRWLFVIPPVVLGVASIVTMIVMSPMARTRIAAYWNPDAHRDGAGLQVRKSLLAFAAGGLHGQGLAEGAEKFRVPEVQTDFILPAVGEDLGLFGSLGVVVAYLVLLLCGVTIADRAPDLHGLLLAGGITFLIAAQAVINIGVVTALFPNKGLPLPFLSRGGSSIAILLTLIGVLLSVARQIVGVERPPTGNRNGSPIRNKPRINPFANPDFAPLE